GGTAHTDAAAITGGALGRVVNRQSQDNGQLDDFAAAHIDSPADIVAKFVPNFYFGAEADDPSVAYAFNQQVNPEGARLNAFWASDSGHWDVPDLTQVLAETWQQVERGALSEQDFKDLVFSNPHRFYSEKNPDFFKNTAVQQPIGNAA
ncbi:MAG TPA: amidohydrolase, partial [Marinobacter sp.]|nr:amidohydrolase [Marinobacter sp.]